MGFKASIAALAFLVAGFVTSPAAAEAWFPVASTSDVTFEIDNDSLKIKGDVIESWMRQTSQRPRKNAAGKAYTTMLMRRSDDCHGRRFALGAYVMHNKSGAEVGSGEGAAGWDELIPGSVAERIWSSVCLAVDPPKEEALLESITEGEWRNLGTSADQEYVLSVRADRVVKLESGYVVAVMRSDYLKPKFAGGYLINHIVTGQMLDCGAEKAAIFAHDLYVSPTLRVKSLQTPKDKIEFVSGAPGTFLAATMKDLCALAVSVKDAKAESGETFTGTAWGVSKGYLVTAAHVVKDAKSILVYARGEKVGEAKVVVNDPANDLAVLKFTGAAPPRRKVLNIAERGASLGKSVFTLGYPNPGVLGQTVKMTAGQVSSTSGYQDDARFLQISVPLQQGNSGGPVLGWDGTVVGVVSAKLTRFDPEGEEADAIAPEMVNYAVKASYIRPMLEDLPDLGGYELVKVVADHDQQVAAAQAAVFMLLVEQ